ncbi:hypothetical protein D9619_010666 [Psilocybe cf. subviscida]|uniref:Uncharacterized protein n=1 Tax=Psilocybe cf. subviscida TaxID=2480587 RepID=A0A8H5B7Y2_9AGAR|nr:hypothetical protein D9619_010666 [Psilocybe cf. subviscida]
MLRQMREDHDLAEDESDMARRPPPDSILSSSSPFAPSLAFMHAHGLIAQHNRNTPERVAVAVTSAEKEKPEETMSAAPNAAAPAVVLAVPVGTLTLKGNRRLKHKPTLVV